MKSLFLAFLLVAVALAVEPPSAAPEPGQTDKQQVDPVPNTCCFDFVKRPVPLRLLKSFEYTNGRCSKPGVVFFTKKGLKICADPAEEWVQDRIRNLGPR